VTKISVRVGHPLTSRVIASRDIKPANLLVNDEEIYVTDFGISKFNLETETTASYGTVGAHSPMYCAPEVYFGGHRRDRKADVYSLGCIFLEMATVICGVSLAEFHDFRQQERTGKRAYAANQHNILRWIAYLTTKAPVIGSSFSSEVASRALKWSLLMVDPEAERRPSSFELANMVFLSLTGCSSCRSDPHFINYPEPDTWYDLIFNLGRLQEGDLLSSSFDFTWEQAWDTCGPIETLGYEIKAFIRDISID
jgi:serine/threonine protein kinase